MSKALRILIILLCFPAIGTLSAQDFLLEGCYWDCPESNSAEIDEASFKFWTDKIQSQAAELGHNGFSYIWLPSTSSQTISINHLVDQLNYLGIQALSDLRIPESTDTAGIVPQSNYWNAFQLNADSSHTPTKIASILNDFCSTEQIPELFIAAPPDKNNALATAGWLNTILQAMSPEANKQIDPKVPDYILREALRSACTDPEFDVRTIYNSSLRDSTTLGTYNVVTFVNNAFFRNQNDILGDSDDPIKNPLLAYAYTLTNNQLGLPAVFYADYYGNEADVDLYLDQEPLKDYIDQLMKVHKQYIYKSTSVEYLNRLGTDKASYYLSTQDGSDPGNALIYQLDGTNTLAGQANTPKGQRDVIVALNFGEDTLRVYQEINGANISKGDFFTDVLGSSTSEGMTVAFNAEFHIPAAIYIELPPQSFSIWVQGSAEPVLAELMEFNADSYKDYIELSWSIPSEKEINGYEIQRAITGGPFEALTWIEANGIANESASYLHIDNAIQFNEAIHYRIKMVSNTGGFEYSSTEELKIIKRELDIELSEGSKDGTKSINVKSSFNEAAKLVVFNAEGDRVLQEEHQIKKGESHKEIDLSLLPNGVYFLNMSTNGKPAWTSRIVKM